MSNLAEILVNTAQRRGDRPALKLGDLTVTYRVLDDESARVAALLAQHGLRPGDRVGIMLPNVPQFAFAYYGTLRAGGTVVPMNILLKRRDILLGDPRPSCSWCGTTSPTRRARGRSSGRRDDRRRTRRLRGGGESPEPAREVVERDGDDAAEILYTSGTTGTPKGAIVAHDNLRLSCEHIAHSEAKDDVTLGALPLFHSFGQTVMLNAGALVGACLAMIPRFEPGAVLETIERDGVTIFAGVPTMFHALLHFPEARAVTPRRCGCASPAAPGFPSKAFGCEIIDGLHDHGRPVQPPRGSASPARSACRRRMKLVDDDGRETPPGEVGEIATRGYHVMKGYWNRPEATREVLGADGWFRTGDLATVDEEGYYFIVDRKKDMIIRGGYNVYPREVEEVLYEHPAVSMAVVRCLG